jgi:outer membrane receptor protein involved in Fe transport
MLTPCLLLSVRVSLAVAQEQDAEEQRVEVVTVTGSRIARRDFEANSPIVTIDREAFEEVSTVAVETVLNQMPQFVPAVTQFDTAEVQSDADTTPGASTLSLRGLGSNRNLVLLDGRRAMPVNASMAVDVNSIPAAALERVEAITGGASSVYGADAMAGVVNFVLRTDFEGIDIDTQYTQTGESDAKEFRISGLFGANFDDGRGNVMIGVEHASREEAFQRDREFFRRGFADPTVNGDGITQTYYSPSPFNPLEQPSQQAITNIFTQAPACVSQFPAQAPPNCIPGSANFFLNDDGTVFTGGGIFGTGEPDGSYRYNGPFLVDGVAFRKIDDEGHIEENHLDALISIPLDRYSVFGRGVYDLTDRVSAFVQANFAETQTETVLVQSLAGGGWSVFIPHGTDRYADSVTGPGPDGVPGNADDPTNPAYVAGGLYGIACAPTGGCTNSEVFPTPQELTALLDSRLNPNVPWQLNRVTDFLGSRGTSNDITTYQTIIGLEGSFTERDWTWEVYASHGVTSGGTAFTGFGSVARYRSVVSAPNYGRGFFQEGNAGPPGNGFGGGLGRCTSGIPPALAPGQTISADCVQSVEADLQNRQRMEQNVVEGNLQGKLADMPAGELRFAAGSSYRDNSYSFQTDILTSEPSFVDSAIGLFPAGSTVGSTEVKEVYGELLVPLIAGRRAVDELNLELGYRRSDNDPTGSVDTYKALFDWSIGDRVRLRGGRQVANRAPNIGELFLSRTQTLNINFIGDMCSERSISPVGANPAFNPDAAEVKAICIARMGPTGAADYYADLMGQPPGGGFNFSFENIIGNPNLAIEEAETYTLGAVLSLERTSLSIDLYQIEISDLIAAQNAVNVYTECFSSATNPTFDPNDPACLLVVRDPATGNQGPTDVTFSNEGALKTAGTDVQINWNGDLGAGGINVNFLVNYLIHNETQLNSTSPFLDWVGTSGPTLESLDPGSYEYRTFTTVSYFRGPLNLSLRWRHLPELESGGAVTNPATNFVVPTDAYDIFDLSGAWQINGNYRLRFGIDNLFDRDPEITGADTRTTIPESSTGAGTTDASFYDVLGRRYYVGVKIAF